MTYRAEIEIGVKGARQLRDVTEQVQTLAEKVDLISANFKPFIQTIQQFESNLSRASATLKRVRAGTDDEVAAIRQYVQAVGQANTARARQNNLIQQEIALQEAAKRKTQPGPTGFSRAQFGPALPPAFIKQQNDQQNFKNLFADLNETAKVISVSNTNTRTSWKRTFDELNETAKAISVSRLNTQASWKTTFDQLNETAKAIAVNRLNTQTSWQETFKQLNETAKAISVSRLNTQTSWQETFKQLNETAKAISVSRLNTQTSWQETFKQLNETAKAISVSRLNTQTSWRETFKQLNETAKAISVSRLNTQTSWQETFKQLNETAKAISVSRLNTQTSWQKTFKELNETAKAISVSRLNTQTSWQKTFKELNETAKAISVSRLNTKTSWQKTLQELTETSQVISLNRLKTQNSWVKALSDLRETANDISKAAERERRQIRNRARRGTVAAGRERQRRTRDAASNALIGGAFPLLFGQGIGASAGGAIGGGLGGLAGGQFGFGLSLVGTAIGQSIDTLVAKSAQLGQALDPLTANLDELVKAAGESGTATENYIKQLEDLRGKTAALDAATSILVSRIGEDGVEALKEFGEDVKDFSKEITIAVTQLNSVVAELINRTGILKALTADLNKGRLLSQAISDPTEEQKPLVERFENARRLQSATLGFAGTKEIDEAETALIASQVTRELNAQLQIKSDTQSIINQNVLLEGENLAVLKIASKIEEKGGDLKLEAVQNLARQKLELELIAEQQRIINELSKEGADFFAVTAKLQALSIKAVTKREALENSINDAVNRGIKSQGQRLNASKREAEQEERAFQTAKISRLRSQITLEKEQNKLEEAINGRQAALEEELKTYDTTTNKLKDILKLSFEQKRAQTESLRVIEQINAEEENALDILNAQRDANEILRQQELGRLKIARERASLALKTSFDRNVEDAQFGLRQAQVSLSDPFGGQQQQTSLFNLEQERERLELTRRLTDQRLALKDAIKTADEASKETAKQDLRNFDAQKTQLEDLLARRQAVEQQQLKQNQILEKYGFIINEVSTALSSSIQAIITGTGSVQEAFTTLFENIGRAFVDLATQVLAQKAFLAVLNLFNPGSSLFSSGSSGFNLSGFGSLAPDAGSGASGFLTGVNFFAKGGNPPVNRPSIVGERGPELFVPRTSGTVVSNDALEALSRYRPENSAQRSNQTVNVNYNVTEVNGMRFVTEDQFRAGLDQAAKNGAKMGQSMTISTLKNSRSQRSKIGL